MRALLLVVLAGCGPQVAPLTSATYSFDALRGRDGSPSATVAGSTLELDALTREVKLTIGGATRRFTMSEKSTVTDGCPGNFASIPQDTRTLDAPNVQLGEFLIDAPMVRADCPQGSGVVVLQSGPATSTGAAPECSAEIICLSYRKR